jgi:gluconolactonase
MAMKNYWLLCSSLALSLVALTGCKSTEGKAAPETAAAPSPPPATIRNESGQGFGSLEEKDPQFFTLIPVGTPLEKLASGFDWSEGPVWVKQGGYLVFSDVPSNTVYRWTPGKGISIHLQPSGYTGSEPRGGEPGSNGLTVDSQGRLVLCEHGDRRVGRVEKDGRHVTLADRYQGKRFNSPNDLVYHSNGDLYFTDPPYGLVGNMNDPKKELPFQGVYRLRPNGAVTLLTDKVTRPNGIALSPDERTLYVAVSDPDLPVIMAYDVKPDGLVANGRVFFDLKGFMKPENKGLPDGLKIDQKGNLFATGPGGVFVITARGQHLGTIKTGEATANCGWGDDGSTLYITADMYLARIKTKTKGLGW